MAEAAFLQRQQARTQSLCTDSRRRKQEHNQYWDDVQSRLRAWQEQLEALNVPQSEADKRSVADQLDDLQVALQAIGGNRSEDLPMVYIRQLFAELSKHQSLLDETRRRLLPRRPFAFRRYRAARKGQECLEPVPKEVMTTEESVPATTLFDANHTVSDVKHADIVLDANGMVSIAPSNGSPTIDRQLASGGTLVLRDLEQCTIKICADYASLHLVHLGHCTLVIDTRIAGAVHVTDCHASTLQLACQQVRLHESTNLCLSVEVSASAMLEGCRDIVFFGTVDVKDFDHLRTNEPSPNFRVEPAIRPPSAAEPLNPDTMASTEVVGQVDGMQEEESDEGDDDEL